jgi:hypothetical protein
MTLNTNFHELPINGCASVLGDDNASLPANQAKLPPFCDNHPPPNPPTNTPHNCPNLLFLTLFKLSGQENGENIW